MKCIPVVLLPTLLYAGGCCGSSGGGLAGGVPILGRGQFSISPGFSTFSAETPTRSTRSIPLSVAGGITDRLTLAIASRYGFMEMKKQGHEVKIGDSILVAARELRYENHGWGDGLASIRFLAIPRSMNSPQEMIFGVDCTIPWGPDSVRSKGFELPREVQSGEGAWGIGGTVSYTRYFPGALLAVTPTIHGKITFKDAHKENRGEQIVGSCTVLAGPFFTMVKTGVTLSGELIGETISASTKPVSGSGGKAIRLSPSLQIECSHWLTIESSCRFPIWEDSSMKDDGENLALRGSLIFKTPLKP